MKNVRILLAGLITGVFLGGVVRHLAPDEITSPPINRHSASNVISLDGDHPETSEPPARPSFDEVCEAKGVDATGLLARYLVEASMEEVMLLMNRVFQRKTQLGHLMWMIQARGLELDSRTTLAWVKLNQPDDLRPLYQRWVVSDPHAALRASLQESSSIRHHMITAIKGADPGEVVAAAKDLTLSGSMLKAVEDMQWVHLAQRDIQKALSDVLALSDGRERKRGLKSIVETWARTDALAAIRWIETEENLEGANGLMEIAIEKLAETQPHLARTKLESLPPSRNREILEGKVVNQWAAQDSEGALNWIKTLPEGAHRDHLFASVIHELDREPKELMALIRELGVKVNQGDRLSRLDIQTDYERSNFVSPQSLSDQYGIVIQDLAKDSPKEALEAMYHSGDLERLDIHRPASPEYIARMWAKSDPKAAADWVLSLPESDVRNHTKESVFRTWAEESPETLVGYLDGDVGNDRLPLAEILASEWFRQDSEAAFAWIDQLQGEAKDSALSAGLTAMAESDPMFALQRLDQLESPQVQDRVLIAATSIWRARDPEGLMSWFELQPPEAEIDNIVSETSRDWVLLSPHDASQWIRAMDESPRKEQAVVGMIDAMTSNSNPYVDVDTAEVWLETLTDPELKQHWGEEVERRSEYLRIMWERHRN